MKWTQVSSVLAVAMAAWLLPNIEVGESAEVCKLNRRAQTTTQVEVYADVPRFSTAKGWITDRSVTKLSKGTSILICEERWVGFIGGQKRWLRIRFGPREGWIFGEGTVTSGLGGHGGFARASHFLSPTSVYAQEPAAVPNAGLPGLWHFYVFLLGSVCLGMTAKALFDLLGQRRRSLRRYGYETLRSLLVAPIVFQGILQYGDLGIGENAGLFALLGMAFQNGFFWQTVLIRAGASKSR